MASVATVVERVHLATTGVVVVVVVVDPLRGLREGETWETWLRGQQRLDRVMHEVAPVLFLSSGAWALLAAGVSARRRQPVAAAARVVAAGCVGAAIAVTLRVSEPVNDRLRSWRATDPPAPGWRAARERWEQGHRLRRALLAVGAVVAFTSGRASS